MCIRRSPQWASLIPAFVLKGQLTYPYEFRLRNGSEVQLTSWDDLTTVWHVFFGAEYQVPTASQTILDLGANIGSFAVWAANRCPNAVIYSLEPFPETFDQLQRTVERNGLEDRVTTLCKAVAGHSGAGQFDATPGKRSYCRRLVPAKSDVEQMTVACVTLNDLLDELELPEVDCIKMDVEGGEYAIFEQCSREELRRTKILTMEYHDADRTGQLWEKLEQCGFECVYKDVGSWSGLASYKRID